MRAPSSGTLRAFAAGAVVFAAGLAAPSERSHPLDCLPDRVVAFEPVALNPAALFGADLIPGIVLGPPGESMALAGSVSVATLGFGGRVTLGFDDIVIEDGPGPDFIVFENPFFRSAPPASAQDDFHVFAEPGIVEVSADGVAWETYPFDAAALQEVADLPATGDVDRDLYLRLRGTAGLTPTFTGNWTVPDDPEIFDPAGTGGISGAGGDAFDLADVGLSEARFIRITDGDTQIGFPGSGEGFDLDAIVALNARPLTPPASDRDGDGLSDAEEELLYESNPDLPDSDGDGTDDGREVAGCRDPADPGDRPFLLREPRLWASGAICTGLNWTFMGSGVAYELVRGELASVLDAAGFIDLGSVACLFEPDDSPLLPGWSCDASQPAAGQGFLYLVRVAGEPDYGRSSNLEARVATGGCP